MSVNEHPDDETESICRLRARAEAAEAALASARSERDEARSMIAESLPFLREAWAECFHGQTQRLLSAQERGMGRLLGLFQAVADGKPELPPGVITRAEASRNTEAALKWAYDLLGDPNAPHEAIQRWCRPGLTAADGLKDAHARVAALERTLRRVRNTIRAFQDVEVRRIDGILADPDCTTGGPDAAP